MSYKHEKEDQTIEEEEYKRSTESYIQRLIDRRLDEETAALMEIKELQYNRLLRQVENNYKMNLKQKNKSI